MSTQIFNYPNSFALESGDILPNFQLSYSTFGTLNPEKDNVIWICHALTANSDVSDWWSGLVGEDKLFDTKLFYVVCANMLGSHYGSTNALSINPATGQAYFHTFPLLTNRDIVHSFDLLRVHLGLEKILLGAGGSMGGQQVLEWSILHPDVFENIFVVATNAHHSPWGIAFNESQRLAIEADQTWKENSEDAGKNGLKAARSIALLSYRNAVAYNNTQSEEDHEKYDAFKAASYQNYQGEKLVNRFNAFSYYTLSKAMDSHHVGRNRGGIENALQEIKAKALILGIRSDILFPIEEQKQLAWHIPNASYFEIDSDFGHDGFLIENEQIARLVGKYFKLGAWEKFYEFETEGFLLST